MFCGRFEKLFTKQIINSKVLTCFKFLIHNNSKLIKLITVTINTQTTAQYYETT